jgi:similar to stage IV sporulation protein
MQLNEEGVKVGNAKRKINSVNVVNNIRLKRNDISWMSVDMKGTNIIVTVVEAEEKPEIMNKDEYCNIVAKKRGMITKITADIGTAQVKVGDIVETGEILIGGFIEGKYTDTRCVHAKGKTEAKVWYTKKLKSGFVREITEETGATQNKYSIKVNNFEINLYKTLPNFENYDKISETNKIKLFKNFYLPIEINKTTYIEQRKVKVTYGKEQLKEILIKELEQQFSNEGIDKLNVTNKVVNFYETEGNMLELEMTYEVIEEIGIEEKLKL